MTNHLLWAIIHMTQNSAIFILTKTSKWRHKKESTNHNSNASLPIKMTAYKNAKVSENFKKDTLKLTKIIEQQHLVIICTLCLNNVWCHRNPFLRLSI